MEKSKVSRFTNFGIVGGFIGGSITSWLAPKAIAWYFDPPVNIGVNCREATEWSMQKLQQAQLFGLLFGAGLSLAAVVFLDRWRNRTENKLP